MNLIEKIELGIIHAKGGGGGSSGAVSWPAYLQDTHSEWLNNTGGDTLTTSLTDVMNTAIGNSPWATEVAYDPDADLVSLIAAPNVLQTLVTLLSSGTSLDALVANILSDANVDDAVTEYAADLDARLNSEIIPRFEVGMLDINAVASSAFVIGKALIEANQDRQVALFSSQLHLKSKSDDALKMIMMKLEYQKSVSQMIAEAYRIKIVAKKEETDKNLDISENDATWDLEVFKSGGSLLAGISGGVPGEKIPSKGQSVLGGAMAGAAAGATIGGPWGAAIGGVLGAASALL